MLLSSLLMVMLVYTLFYIMFYKKKLDMEMVGPYECGFDPYSMTRLGFSYRFYLISILFIIFDVEVSLMLPVPFLVGKSLGLWIFLLFIVILIVGLLYEYYCGSLDWLDKL